MNPLLSGQIVQSARGTVFLVLRRSVDGWHGLALSESITCSENEVVLLTIMDRIPFGWTSIA